MAILATVPQRGKLQVLGKGSQARPALLGLAIWWDRYLEEQGSGTFELATLDPNDASDVAGHIPFELNVPMGDYLEEAIVQWIREAKSIVTLFGELQK